ncbi:MAG: FAD-dependent thymidylate synthase [Parcubacteria group bacterium]
MSLAALTPEEHKLLQPYVTSTTDHVFLVRPDKLPGMVGACFARYSRTSGGFRQTLVREFIKEKMLNPDKADQLINRVLNEFGDESIQELEGTYLSLERISNIVTKKVEDGRIGLSPIEQSTRFVWYDELDEQGDFLFAREPSIMQSALADRYVTVQNGHFETYSRLKDPMKAYYQRCKPLETARYQVRRGDDKVEVSLAECLDDRERATFKRIYDEDLRTKACDTLRCLLPLATLTNVGIFANGRALAAMLKRLYSTDIPECVEVAKKAHAALRTVMPRYVQRAQRDEYLVSVRENMQRLTDELVGQIVPDKCQEVEFLGSGYSRHLVIALMLFEYCQLSAPQLMWVVGLMDRDTQQRVINTYVGKRRTRFDRVGRALEVGYRWQFHVRGDAGAMRDLHRHRMMGFMRQRFTTCHGFKQISPDLEEAGFRHEIQQRVEVAHNLYETVLAQCGRDAAQYCTLMGHLVDYAMLFNDREAEHTLELRSGKPCHWDYRRPIQAMDLMMRAADDLDCPELRKFVDHEYYTWPRADQLALTEIKNATP